MIIRYAYISFKSKDQAKHYEQGMAQPPVPVIGNEPDKGVIKKNHAGIVLLHRSKLLNQQRTRLFLYQRTRVLYETDIFVPVPFFCAYQVMKPVNSRVSIKPGLVYIIHPYQRMQVGSFVL